MKKILIYMDEGCSELGVKSLLHRVSYYFNAQVETIDAKQILVGGLTSASMLIIPGGRDLPYCAKLNGRGNQFIRDFVANGGIYVGICAGAYYGCSELNFKGKNYTVNGARELAFFDGLAIGSLPHLTAGHYYDETLASKAIVSLYWNDGSVMQCYYHGGCQFVSNSGIHQILARYSDGSAAVICGEFGRGYYLLSGVHFELHEEIYRCCVVEMCQDVVEKWKEQQICCYFDQKYGLQIWQVLQNILK